MSLATALGLDKAGEQSVTEARAALAETVAKLGPLFQEIENRGGGIFHGLLDRLNGTKLKIVEGGFVIEIPPVPKAEKAE